MTLDEKRHRYSDAKALFEQAKVAHPDMKPQEVILLLIKERLACMTSHGKWQDQWLVDPIRSRQCASQRKPWPISPTGDYDEDHQAWLYNKASLRGVDSFFNQVRRLSLLERSIHSKYNKVRKCNGYSPYSCQSPRHHADGPQLHPNRQGWQYARRTPCNTWCCG